LAGCVTWRSDTGTIHPEHAGLAGQSKWWHYVSLFPKLQDIPLYIMVDNRPKE
jgi:hypothetical protein